jgi:hypothetical protein
LYEQKPNKLYIKLIAIDIKKSFESQLQCRIVPGI